MMDTVRRSLGALLDLIYPPCCAGCGRVDHELCAGCTALLTHTHNLVFIPPPTGLTLCVALGLHRGILRRLVTTLKYDARPALASPLGSCLAEACHKLDWQIDCVVPVPLHTSRLRQRGYNQSEVIAQAMAARTEHPVCTTALRRVRATTAQVGLTGEERRRNLAGAFLAAPEQVAGQHILLIDDVFTTGSTLQACAEALFEAGAHHVSSLTVTVAQ